MGVNCSTADEMLSPFLDGELTPEENIMLLEHLEGCAYCSHQLSDLKRLAAVLREFGQQQITAPSGFSNSVISRIKDENKSVQTRKKHLKQAGLSAAAILLLVAGSTFMKPAPVGQIAQVPGQVEQKLDSTGAQNPGQQNTTNADQVPITTAGGSSADNGAAATQNQTTADISVNTSGAEFTSTKDHVIVSTFIKIKVANSAEAESLTRSYAASSGASIQSLGQQTQNGNLCLVNKIVLNSTDSSRLVDRLTGLGTVISRQEETADLNERYSQLYDQLLTLKNQNRDGALNQQIQEIERQLRSLDEQTSTATIVLWLQQQ